MSDQFADNPDYVTYKRLLIELDQLIAGGKGDDEEAEAVRDQMDGPWYRLSSEETDHIRSLPTNLKAEE